MSGLMQAIEENNKWCETENGQACLNTSGSFLVDFMARAGSMRDSKETEQIRLFDKAYQEDELKALRLLFYIRDVRGGAGERDTFRHILRYVGTRYPNVIKYNMWAVMEYGRADDLYSLIGTRSEEAMWDFMKNQFMLDLEKMILGQSVSLLAKWMPSYSTHSANTRRMAILTANKLGYTEPGGLREYSKHLTALRKYLDIVEIKIASGNWDEIVYANCTSKFYSRYKKSIAKHDAERWNSYLNAVANGEQKMNTSTLTPCDIINKILNREYTDADLKSYELQWDNLPSICDKNVLIMADTSGSMVVNKTPSGMSAAAVAWSLAMYFASRNTGSLKDKFMTFNASPKFVDIRGGSLLSKVDELMNAPWGFNTNLESAFNTLLELFVKNNIDESEMPSAIVVISDMQIDKCLSGAESSDGGSKMLFHNVMYNKYKNAGYSLPQVIYWNVYAKKPTFHATAYDGGIAMVSSFSPNVLNGMVNSIGKSAYELMLDLVNSDRYKDINIYENIHCGHEISGELNPIQIRNFHSSPNWRGNV